MLLTEIVPDMHVARAKIANSSKTLRPQLSVESGSDDDLEDIDDILDSLKAHILCLTDLAPHLHSMAQISARPKAVGPPDPSAETSVKEGSEDPNQELLQKGLNLSGSQVALEPQRSTPDAHGQQIICHYDISSEAPGISSRTSNYSKSPPAQFTATATAATPNNQIHNSIQSQDKKRQLGKDQYELQQVGRDQSKASATAAPREIPRIYNTGSSDDCHNPSPVWVGRSLSGSQAPASYATRQTSLSAGGSRPCVPGMTSGQVKQLPSLYPPEDKVSRDNLDDAYYEGSSPPSSSDEFYVPINHKLSSPQ